MTRSLRTCLAFCTLLAGVPLAAAHAAALAGGMIASPRSQPEGNAEVPEFIRVFREQAARAPRIDTTALPPPPGIDVSSLKPLPPEALAPGSDAVLTAAEVIAKFAALFPEDLKPLEPREIDPDDELEALRLYAQGRESALDNQMPAAIEALNESVQLDPNHAAAWSALADAQLSQNRRSAAAQSLVQAVRRGLSAPRVWLLLARDAAQTRRTQRGAALLSHALSTLPQNAQTPENRAVLTAELAQLVATMGYTTAARAMLEETLMDSALAGAAQPGTDLGDLFRRRSELLLRAGDLAFSLNDLPGASRLYQSAGEDFSLDGVAISIRRMYVSVLTGDAPAAGEALLRDMQRSQGRVEQRQLELLRYLSRSAGLGPALDAALRLLPQDFDEAPTPSIAGRLARARAALVSGEPAAVLLRQHLSTSPQDADVAMALLEVWGTSPPAARAGELITLTQASPQHGFVYAQLLVRQGIETSRVVDEMRRRGPSLALAWALWSVERTEDAWAIVTQLPQDGSPALLAARARIGTDAAHFTESLEALENLKATPNAPLALVAATLAALDREDEAVNLIGDAKPRADFDALIVGGAVATALGRVVEAEQFLERAIELDRFDERPYAQLFELFSPSGPARNDAKLGSAIRRLRDAVSGSRVLRGIIAQDLVQRQAWAQAEPALLSLLEEDSSETNLVGLLTEVWTRMSTPDQTQPLERGEAWLRAKLAERNESAPLVAGLSRVLDSLSKTQDAEDALVALYEKLPLSDIARLRERLVRVSLRKPVDARNLATARLQASPATADNTLELAQYLLESADPNLAAAALREHLPEQKFLSERHKRSLLALLINASQFTREQRSPMRDRAALSIIDVGLERGLELTSAMHDQRLSFIASADPTNLDRMLAASEQMESAVPAAQVVAVRARGADLLSDSPAPRLGPAFMRRQLARLAERKQPRSLELVTELLRLSAKVGDAEDISLAVNDLRPNEATQILSNLVPGMGELEENVSDARAKTEILYQFASYAQSVRNIPAMVALYEEALRIQPGHAGVNNDYGYWLADNNQSLERAQAMLEIALLAEPHNPSYLDSMGWLRYKLNMLEDETRPDGSVRQGAISLLTDALEQESDAGQVVMLEHLADAQWAAGKKADAQRSWSQAATLSQQWIRAMGTQSQSLTTLLEEVRSRSEAKVRKAAAGEEPAIAPRGELPPATPSSAPPGSAPPSPDAAPAGNNGP